MPPKDTKETDSTPYIRIGKTDSFPEKLYDAVEKCDGHYPEIACFCRDAGGGFIVKKPDDFMEKQKEFKVCKSRIYSSLEKQLANWGIGKIKGSAPAKYQHEKGYFRKEDRDLLSKILPPCENSKRNKLSSRPCKRDEEEPQLELVGIETRLQSMEQNLCRILSLLTPMHTAVMQPSSSSSSPIQKDDSEHFPSNFTGRMSQESLAASPALNSRVGNEEQKYEHLVTNTVKLNDFENGSFVGQSGSRVNMCQGHYGSSQSQWHCEGQISEHKDHSPKNIDKHQAPQTSHHSKEQDQVGGDDQDSMHTLPKPSSLKNPDNQVQTECHAQNTGQQKNDRNCGGACGPEWHKQNVMHDSLSAAVTDGSKRGASNGQLYEVPQQLHLENEAGNMLAGQSAGKKKETHPSSHSAATDTIPADSIEGGSNVSPGDDEASVLSVPMSDDLNMAAVPISEWEAGNNDVFECSDESQRQAHKQHTKGQNHSEETAQPADDDEIMGQDFSMPETFHGDTTTLPPAQFKRRKHNKVQKWCSRSFSEPKGKFNRRGNVVWMKPFDMNVLSGKRKRPVCSGGFLHESGHYYQNLPTHKASYLFSADDKRNLVIRSIMHFVLHRAVSLAFSDPSFAKNLRQLFYCVPNGNALHDDSGNLLLHLNCHTN